MKRRNWKRKVILALTVIMAGTAASGIQHVNAKSKTVTGNYQKLYASATSTSAWVDIYNQNPSTKRYVYVSEITLDNKGQIISKDYCDGVISSGSRTAFEMGLKDVKSVMGTGKIYKGETNSSLLETKTAIVTP